MTKFGSLNRTLRGEINNNNNIIIIIIIIIKPVFQYKPLIRTQEWSQVFKK